MSDRKINMQRVRSMLLWSFLLGGIVTLSIFSIRRKANADINAVKIEIVGVLGDQSMISEAEVKRMLMEGAGKPLTKAAIRSLDLRKLEVKLNKDKRIERADIYMDAKDVLHVLVIQKTPVMRVINETTGDYYLDINGKMIPHTVGSSIRVPIVTGITETFTPKIFTADTNSKLRDIYFMMVKVQKDPFLSSLIEQVHVSADSIGDIILIPKIGREQLIIGDASGLDEKFEKLKIFYQDGLPRLGWNRYKTLNLKYTAQVTGQLVNPNIPKIKSVEIPRDSIQTAMATTTSNKESIHH